MLMMVSISAKEYIFLKTINTVLFLVLGRGNKAYS